MIATVSLALLLGASSQDLSKKLDYEAPGIPASKVVQELSERTGVRLAANPVMGANPLVIFVKGVTLKELLDRIGAATEGTWSPDSDGTLRLVPLPAKNVDAERLAARVARYSAYQAKLRKDFASAKPFDRAAADTLVREIETHISNAANAENNEWYQKGEKLGEQGPMSLLAKRIVVELDPRALAVVQPRRKTAWSSRPTRMQLALPSKASEAIQAFVKEYEVWTSAVGSRSFTYPQNRGLSTSLYYLVQNNFDWNQTIDLTPSTNDLSKLLVFATSWSGEGARQVEVRLVDKRGKYVAQASVSLDVEGAGQQAGPAVSMEEIMKSSPADEPEVALKPVAVEIAKRFGRMMGGMAAAPEGELPPLSSEAEFALFNPDKVEPISIGFPDFMSAIHGRSKLNIVASPPDFIGMYSLVLSQQNIKKASQMLRMMRTPMFGLSVKEESGWLVIGNRTTGTGAIPPGLERRMNRVALGQLLRQVKQDGMVRIDPLAEFSYRTMSDNGDDFPLEFVYLGIVTGNNDFMALSNGQWLRFYGSLDGDQRQAARAGRLTIGNLRADQRSMVDSIVFGAENYGLQYEPKDENQDWELFHGGIKGEPTERFGNGLPPQARLTMTDLTEDVVLARGTTKWGPTSTHMNVTELANHYAMLEVPQVPSGGEWEPPQYSSFEMQSRRQVQVKVTLDPEVSISGTLSESKQTGRTFASLDQLPEPFKSKFLAEKAKLVEQRRKWQEAIPPLAKR